METKKNFSMDALVDLSMTKLFLLAEYVCDKTSFACGREILLGQASHRAERQPQTVEPIPPKDIVPTIRFSKNDKSRMNNKMVEGELFV